MGKKSRFLSLSYVANSLVIKAKSLVLRLERGAYPFDYFKNRTLSISDIEYTLEFSETYQSLEYLNHQKAILFHSGNRSITQDLIIGLVYFNDLLKHENLPKSYLFDLAEKLVNKGEESEKGLTFYFNETYPRFDLKGNYYSGLVQGKAASFFLRCYRISDDERYKVLAKKCLQSACNEVIDGGVSRALTEDMVWVEEYPSPNPSMVLNGFLFYILGLAEYLTFENDEELKSQLDLCLKSVIAWMPNYKQKNGILYSMYRWNLCNVHYTGIMKYQFEHLYHLTDIPMFKEYADFMDAITNWKTFTRLFES